MSLVCLFIGVLLMRGLDDRSRMNREVHVRVCEGLSGKFPRIADTCNRYYKLKLQDMETKKPECLPVLWISFSDLLKTPPFFWVYPKSSIFSRFGAKCRLDNTIFIWYSNLDCLKPVGTCCLISSSTICYYSSPAVTQH